MRSAAVVALCLAMSGCSAKGSASFEPDILPIEFTIDTTGQFSTKVARSIVTPLGVFKLGVELQPDPTPPQGKTLVYIDHDANGQLTEDRFELSTTQALDVVVDGRALLHVEDRFLRITAQDDITTITLRGGHAAPAASGTSPQAFVPFGTATDSFGVSLEGSTLTISPPLGADRYAALWGAFFPGASCATVVEFDVRRLTSDEDAANYGFAVAPRSSVSGDQPTGASIQYEQEAQPDFPVEGSFVRPATLPAGAWTTEVSPLAAPPVDRSHHVKVAASGNVMTIAIDGRTSAIYRSSEACGGVAFRAWGSAFRFTDLAINSSL